MSDLLYTTVGDFEAYVEGWETDDPDALKRLLVRAQQDVDNVFGPLPVLNDGPAAGLKLNPAILRAYEKEALSRAVCAQAEWRFRRTDDELNGSSAGVKARVKGPDFEVQYDPTASSNAATQGTGLYSPRLALELAPISHLRRLVARIGP